MDTSWFHLIFYTIFFINVFFIFAVIFIERKSPASTLAWVLALMFVPVLGFVGYLVFGSGFRVDKRKKYEMKMAADKLYHDVVLKCVEMPDVSDLNENATRHARLVRYLHNEGYNLYTDDNAAQVFTDGQSMLDAMMDDMRAATRHIHLFFYIFRDDEVGRAVVDLLTEKAKEGVEVRLSYDSLGSMLGFERLFRELREAGGEVEAFSPLVSRFSSSCRLNFRNHRKITVIDGVIGYVGGMNIGREYLGRDKKCTPWRDTHMRITGSAVIFLQERFLLDWLFASEADGSYEKVRRFFPVPKKEGSLGMQIVSSGPDISVGAIKHGLLEMIYSAKKRLYIQTPYFSPDDGFLEALRIASRAGVDVRLMIPDIADHPFVHESTCAYALELLNVGVRVYMYRGFLHAKTITVDGEVASMGSANIGNRSFALNFEINAFIYDSDFVTRQEQIFLHDQEQCDELDSKWYMKQPLYRRALFRFCRLFAPMI